jgi:protein phosphatase methylesterase 1
LSAVGYFEQALEVDVDVSEPPTRSGDNATFRVYYTPPRPLSPSSLELKSNVLFVFHHGAGYSALSYACLAKEIATRTNGEAGSLAFDARMHGTSVSEVFPFFTKVFTAFIGRTNVPADASSDYALSSLSSDLVRLLKAMFPDRSKAPHLVLVGHSMVILSSLYPAAGELLLTRFWQGGAVVTDACPQIQKEVADVIGLSVLDVVEGSARFSLGRICAI